MAAADASGERTPALIGSLAFLVMAPGMVAGFLPWVISRWQVGDPSGDVVLRPLGIAAIVLGTVVLVEAFARFALQGLGTPAPVYPTRRLVMRGTYRYVRNPMYLAVEGVILGQAALFGRVDLVIYGAMVAVAFYLFVVMVEEPMLRRAYPQAYRRYVQNVPRWLPRLRPWAG